MIILSFDTCFQACSVAVGSVELTAGPQSNPMPMAFHFEAREKGHAEVIVPLIERVLMDASTAPSRVDRIAVTHGPGSFTGTRINVAAARALGLAMAVPVHATTSLRVMGRTAVRRLTQENEPLLNGKHNIVVIVDARRDAVYALACSPSGAGADADVALLSIEDAARLAGEGGAIFVGTGAQAVCAQVKKMGGRASYARLPDLQPDALDLWQLAALDEVALADPIIPLYLRPADAKPQTGKSIERI